MLAAIPGGAESPLYARVDLIPGPDGSPVLVELELTEPSLFLDRSAGAAERFAGRDRGSRPAVIAVRGRDRGEFVSSWAHELSAIMERCG